MTSDKRRERDQQRAAFQQNRAPVLLRAAGFEQLAPLNGGTRLRRLSRALAYFSDTNTLAVVCWPDAETDSAELALAHAVFHATEKRLVLFVPKGWERSVTP